MKLVFCLGNPGPKYHQTRHNVGFMVADALASKQVMEFTEKTKLKTFVAELTIYGEKIIVAKPTTFYNDVGISLSLIMNFYKLSCNDILVVHDELALPFGTLRARTGGSDAGNNGVKSVNQHGGLLTHRLRIGVGSDMRALVGDTDFVLGAFSVQEREMIQHGILPKAIEVTETFAKGNHVATSHTVIPETPEPTTRPTL